MVQRVRDRAYETASSAIQRIRELNEPHRVDGISVCLDFLERTGADAQAIMHERAALAEARERRRVEMGYEPFDAHAYYSGLRALGADPCVRRYEHGGSLVESISHLARSGDAGPLNLWACFEDPDRQLRRNYMLSVWGVGQRVICPCNASSCRSACRKEQSGGRERDEFELIPRHHVPAS